MGALNNIRQRLLNPDPLMQAVGIYMRGVTRLAFRQQGRPGGPQWVEREVPNAAGILSDLRRGRTPPARRWQGRPSNIDTGALARSISWIRKGKDEIEVGSWEPYASHAQSGGIQAIPIDQTLRQALRAYIKSRRGQNRIQLQRRFSKALRTGVLVIDRLPRPYLMVLPADVVRMTQMSVSWALRGRP